MKKTYQTPETRTVLLSTMQMLAASDPKLLHTGFDVNEEVLSREDGFLWDE